MRDGDNSLAQSLALVGQLGFTIACPMVAFIGGGAWADGQLGTKPWLLFLGIFLGIAAAAGALYRLSTALSSKKPARSASKAKTPTRTEGADDNSGMNRANNQKPTADDDI